MKISDATPELRSTGAREKNLDEGPSSAEDGVGPRNCRRHKWRSLVGHLPLFTGQTNRLCGTFYRAQSYFIPPGTFAERSIDTGEARTDAFLIGDWPIVTGRRHAIVLQMDIFDRD